MNREERLLAYLEGACSGRDYRVGGKELERTLNLSGTELRKLVNRLRQQNKPIASDQTGYFYAQTAGEVYATIQNPTIQNLKKMRAGLDAAIRGLERSLDDFPVGR